MLSPLLAVRMHVRRHTEFACQGGRILLPVHGWRVNGSESCSNRHGPKSKGRGRRNSSSDTDSSTTMAVIMGLVLSDLFQGCGRKALPLVHKMWSMMLCIPLPEQKLANQSTDCREPQYYPIIPYISHYSSFHFLFHYPNIAPIFSKAPFVEHLQPATCRI